MNIFFVDWFNISSKSYVCYPSIVHNLKHVGECIGQLVKLIKKAGSEDIHLIGFSLGAQVTNYVAQSLNDVFKIKRISGVDPAFPGFITVEKQYKLGTSCVHCYAYILQSCN